MQVQVFHINGGERVHVANVEVPNGTSASDACEFAYRWTQNIMDSWSMKMPEDGNDAVTVIAALPSHGGKTYGLRSSMMGDEFVYDGKTYYCATFGFKEVA